MEKLAKTESQKWKVPRFNFEILADLPGSETEENSELIKLTAKTIQRVARKKAKLIGMPAFTFAGLLRAQKIPTVAFGPGKLEECHRSNEKVLQSEVIEFTEILIELLKNIELK
jgi:di/tripeptidase